MAPKKDMGSLRSMPSKSGVKRNAQEVPMTPPPTKTSFALVVI